MKTVIYTKLNEKLLKDWQELWEKSIFSNYFNGPQWFVSSINTFGHKEYAVIALYKGNSLMAVVPLIVEKKYGLKIFTTAPADYVCGHPFLGDLQGRRLLQHIYKQAGRLGAVVFNNVPEEAVPDQTIYKHNAPFIHTGLNFYLNIVSDSTGKANIKNRKKLMREARGHEDEFKLVSYKNNLNLALKVVFEIDEKSRKRSRGYNTFANPEIRRFFTLLAKNCKEFLRINILYFRDKPVAYEVGFLIRNTYFGDQVAFDENCSKYSPGKVMEVKLLDCLAGEGVTQLDYGPGDNHIKRTLTKDYRKLYKIILANNKFVQIYLSKMFSLHHLVFEEIRKHTRIYSSYRSLKKALNL